MMDGAARSIGSSDSAVMAPLPSSGRPSGSTTRPSRPGPTGTRTTSPVACTASPAATVSTPSSSTHPTRPRSSTCAKPNWPPAKRSFSSSRTPGRPETRATPSPTSSTRPIWPAWGPRVAAATCFDAAASQSATCPLPPRPSREQGAASQHGFGSRSARQLLDTAKCGPCSSIPAMSAGSARNRMRGWAPNASAISRAGAILLGLCERLRASPPRTRPRLPAPPAGPPRASRGCWPPANPGKRR